MQRLDNLGYEPNQRTQVQLADGSTVDMTFRYLGAVQRWVVDVTWQQTVLLSLNLVVAPNMLRQWKNLIPLGLAVTSTDGVDPVAVQDFSSGRVSVYILDSAEVAAMEAMVVAS